MIKHNSATSVLSAYNPIVTLNARMRQRVNEEFIQPILKEFFSDKSGIDNFEELDPDMLKTEIEFQHELNFVKTYIYKEVMNDLKKDIHGHVIYKPKYLISFDEDLTNFDQSKQKYPQSDKNIRYGVMLLGEVPMLYFIYIELQELIRFIKTLPKEPERVEPEKTIETSEIKRNRLIDELVGKQFRLWNNTPTDQKQEVQDELNRLINLSKQKIQGNSGSLRVNLSWNTTDDLDLHITTENGKKINFQNKVLEYNGSIGKLDVDANASNPIVSNPQENVNWDIIPSGKHTISVDFFRGRELAGKTYFTVFIENGEDSRIYNSCVEPTGANRTQEVVEFELINGVLAFKELLG
ncbi:hypothetical protein [Haliscomenobacter hydrossis]|uniref:Uncharacterized protein n=1 Tax=Haliscomenobacter hydrossis (strain ATCC 27775 / DSM 1100 / LMG 10767 / O) TaxID=760192 RepID=F4L5B8_HALH1|nr:hypothetical protein [Haliscomenobacter hydrossis]AEE49798.1 hypothetical protein Halhy_1913 [Haliscomenobacter hydrossis DSM 1100]